MPEAVRLRIVRYLMTLWQQQQETEIWTDLVHNYTLLADLGRTGMRNLFLLVTGHTVHSGHMTVAVLSRQGFMQDQIIASHTCFGGHFMDVNC